MKTERDVGTMTLILPGMWALAAMIAGILASPLLANAAAASDLPRGMVHLRDVAPGIQQDMRYAGRHNFLGRRVRGYQAGECIVTRRTARALRRVQRQLRPMGLSLKVYDCYRPMRAVREFVRWSRDARDTRAKAEFYPTIKKRSLFARRYISKRSKHTRGNTVDLAIVPRGSKPPPYDADAPQKACHKHQTRRAPDNALDFGTGYDCFHANSGWQLPQRNKTAWKNRQLLNRVMGRQGFRGYKREWWHFTLPGAGTRQPMDFVVR